MCVLVVAGCTDQYCVDELYTIEQGAYGQLTYRSDIGGSEPTGIPKVFTIYRGDPIELLGRVPSDERGLYQVVLPGGGYTFCLDMSCGAITVPDAGVIRFDYVSGFGGGSWDAERHTCLSER